MFFERKFFSRVLNLKIFFPSINQSCFFLFAKDFSFTLPGSYKKINDGFIFPFIKECRTTCLALYDLTNGAYDGVTVSKLRKVAQNCAGKLRNLTICQYINTNNSHLFILSLKKFFKTKVWPYGRTRKIIHDTDPAKLKIALGSHIPWPFKHEWKRQNSLLISLKFILLTFLGKSYRGVLSLFIMAVISSLKIVFTCSLLLKIIKMK